MSPGTSSDLNSSRGLPKSNRFPGWRTRPSLCIDPGFDYEPFGFTGHRASAEVVQEFPERVAAGPAHLRAPPRPRTAKYSSRRQSARIRTLRRFASQDGTTGPDSLGVGYATDREDL